MSLSILIEKYIQNIANNEKQTVESLKEDNNLKNLSKYIRGGLSKLRKNDLINLIDTFKKYKKNKYIIYDKEIIPDEEQQQIISANVNYNIRVIAGAGTGKTTTIGCRIKYLLDSFVLPDKILVLTFNVEARKNLELMMDKLFGFDIKMEIRTIDSFCSKLIYEIENEKNNNISFEDITNIYSLSELGIRGKKIMEKYHSAICQEYEYVFFDEFQDVNEDQFQILKYFVMNNSSTVYFHVNFINR